MRKRSGLTVVHLLPHLVTLVLFPMVSAAAGYLLAGVTSAASGPFILAWLLGTR
jgi:hypothetical protein